MGSEEEGRLRVVEGHRLLGRRRRSGKLRGAVGRRSGRDQVLGAHNNDE